MKERKKENFYDVFVFVFSVLKRRMKGEKREKRRGRKFLFDCLKRYLVLFDAARKEIRR